MLWRGEPVDLDNIGGNRISYPVFASFADIQPGATLPWTMIISGMQALQIHKNTQLRELGIDYENLRAQVVQDYNTARQNAGMQVESPTNADPKKIKYLGDKQYANFKKYIFRIYNLKRYPKVKNVIREEMERLSTQGGWQAKQFGKSTDRWGNNDNPIWKAFFKSKNELDAWEVSPQFLHLIIPPLQEMGYDVSEMTQISSSEKETEQITQKLSAKEERGTIIVDFNGFPGKDNIAAIKNAGFKGKKESNNWLWVNYDPDIKVINNFINLMENQQYDCSELKEVLKNFKGKENDPTTGIKLRVRDVTQETNSRWHIAVGFLKKGTEEGEILKEAMRFSFPVWAKTIQDKKGNRAVNTDTWETFLAGTQQEYFNFINTLDKRGFDTMNILQILSNLTKSGIIQNQIGVGILDGYENEDDFYNQLKKYDLPFDLYSEQMTAIKNLYTHKSFMRGDETGSGKSVISILAADMRMKQSGGRSVIITKVAIQDQFMKAIAEFLGLDINDKRQISSDPLDKAQWTVLTYNQFSQSPQIEKVRVNDKIVEREIVKPNQLNGRVQLTNELVKQVQSGEIQCVILDEIHNVKNGKEGSRDNSNRRRHQSNHTTFNVQDFTSNVPFVWGLSATIVANKPIDVYNQLKAVNHPLGTLSWKKFAQEFGGMHRGDYGMEAGSIKEQIEAVSKLKEYLFDQKAYDALSKKRLNVNLPDQIISQDSVSINENILWDKVAERVKKYKQPDLPVSQMQAFRNEAAIIKAPKTVREAIPTLEKGEKIMIFTDFKDSLETISNGLQSYFDSRGQGEQVVKIKGGMHKKTRTKVIDAFKDHNSKARAIVINIVAGGTGLDFPNIVTQAIVNDYDWSVANDEQMLGRNYRINSKSDVYVKYMIAENTPDEDYYKRLSTKKQIADIIHKMAREEDTRLGEGERSNKNKDLAKLQKELAEMKKKYVQMEMEDKHFEEEIARRIKGKIKKKANKNWYSKRKFG